LPPLPGVYIRIKLAACLSGDAGSPLEWRDLATPKYRLVREIATEAELALFAEYRIRREEIATKAAKELAQPTETAAGSAAKKSAARKTGGSGRGRGRRR
jgi:hypothetical protein